MDSMGRKVSFDKKKGHLNLKKKRIGEKMRMTVAKSVGKGAWKVKGDQFSQ